MNHPAAKKRSTRLEFDGESLRSADDNTWEPRSLWAVVDGLDAIRWCHILFEVGEERQINLFFDEMTRRARERPDKIEIFREYYAAVSWSICMAMRVNKTYKEASDAILADVTMWNEYMARDPEPKESRKRRQSDTQGQQADAEWTPRPPQPTTYKGKGKGRKGNKGYDQGQQQWRQWQSQTSWSRLQWTRQQLGASPPGGVPGKMGDNVVPVSDASGASASVVPEREPSLDESGADGGSALNGGGA